MSTHDSNFCNSTYLTTHTASNPPMKHKRIMILAASIAIAVIAVSLVAVFSENQSSAQQNDSPPANVSRIACLGDSITAITGYPSDLQAFFGNSSVVGNFGVSSSTVAFYTDKPYFFEPQFKNATRFAPTTVVIMLGTNDARTDNYGQIKSFVADYEMMIYRIETLTVKPKIFLVLPPPIFNNTLSLNSTDFVQGVIPRIQQVAKAENLTLIDVYTPLLSHPEYFPDGVHPNSQGAQLIASIIYKAIAANQK